MFGRLDIIWLASGLAGVYYRSQKGPRFGINEKSVAPACNFPHDGEK